MKHFEIIEIIAFAGAFLLVVIMAILAVRERRRSLYMDAKLKAKQALLNDLQEYVFADNAPTLFSYHPKTTNGECTGYDL